MKIDHGALLPNGMMDGLYDEAERESRTSAQLLDLFARFGYRQANPPLVEFEESLIGETGSPALANNAFRLMDPISRRMMAVRPDATVQIVRIAASRLKSAPRPLRLSYVADVLRVKGSQLRPERQFKQVGCELLGPTSPDASAESALLAVHALHQIGVQNVSIDFNAPEIVSRFVESMQNPDAVIHACQRRDESSLEKFGAAGKSLVRINQAAGPATEFFRQVKALKLPAEIKESVARLHAVLDIFQQGLEAYDLEKSVAVTIDPLESGGFEYETSPSFTLFAKGTRGELGRGGFYEAKFRLDEKKFHEEPANGFTLYMDSILRAMPNQKPPSRIYVPPSTEWKDVRTLQEQGFMVVRGNNRASTKEILASQCSHIYKNGAIKSVQERE